MKRSQKYTENSIDTKQQPNSNSIDDIDDKQLVQTIPIEETPFTALKYENNWYLTMGKYRLTQAMENLEAVKEAAKDASWDRILQIIQIMINENQEKKTT